MAGYIGLDLVAEAESGGTGHDVDIISGATVTVMVIDDSIVRSGLKVARALGLGGLTAPEEASGPVFEVNPDAAAAARLDDAGGRRHAAPAVAGRRPDQCRLRRAG